MFKAARVVPLLISPITRGPCSLRPENRRDQLRPREAVSSVSADTWCVLRSSPGSPHQHIRIVSWKWSQACVGKKTLDFKLVFFVWLVCMCVCVCVLCCCCCCFSTCWRKAVLFKQSHVWYGWFTLTRRLCKGVYLRVSTFFPGFVYRFRWPWPIFKVIGGYILSCWHAHFPALRERQLSICSSCIFVFFSN